MQQQKLYTEEQVRKALMLKSDIKYITYSDDNIVDSLTPIELPSDEEIMEEAYKQGGKIFSFTNGSKWMRDKILNK